LGNILWWFPFFGFVNALVAYFFGLLFLATVIAAPIGLGLIQLGTFYLAPFGQTLIPASELGQQTGARGVWNFFAALLWLPIGIVLAVTTAIQIGGLFISIVGIPVALGLAKSFGAIFNPVGKLCRPMVATRVIVERPFYP
jgi:uncharacterized membrane protein YccF (DUF307 family)